MHLQLGALGETAPVIPDTFMGRSVSRVSSDYQVTILRIYLSFASSSLANDRFHDKLLSAVE
jgi:hypothetical protein